MRRFRYLAISSTPLLVTVLALLGCSGPDDLTEPVIPASRAGSISSGGSASGGTGTGVASGGAGANTAFGTFDWGTTAYNANQGTSVTYQAHLNGTACLGTCHLGDSFNAAGTLYLSDGTAYGANAQVGIYIDGTLSTTYAGTQGNFFVTLPSVAGWASAQIAVRNANGTLAMPANASATGNCNSCHDTTNRVVVP